MDAAAKRYARRILLIHLLLLAAVLAMVLLTSREVYQSTRDEVISQARARQELLANQTARGIENHYESIINNLDLLRRAENEEGAAATSSPAAETALQDRATANAARSALFGPILWKQLQGRVSLLMSFDRAELSRARQTIRIIGTDDPSLSAEQVVTQAKSWLETVEKPSVGEFQMIGGAASNLVCVPFPHVIDPAQPPRGPAGPPPAGAPGSNPRDEPPGARFPRLGQRLLQPREQRDTFRLLIAVVPIHGVETQFLKSLNDDADTGAWLIDEKMNAMAASRPELVGANMADISDAGIRAIAADYVQRGRTGTVMVPRSFSIGTAQFHPSMVSAEPISVAGKTWELFIATPMAQVDGVVTRLFHRAVLWGVIVILSITAILVSTAVQMIRSRVRLERERHDVLARELSQAREIQLAWLPDGQPSQTSIDVAAINSPASHISGDFYNWFDLPDGRLVVTIGDVTGHGMAAAFLMATTQLLVRNTMARLGDPGKCLTEVNRQLCVQVFNGQFVTMLVMVVDVASGALQIVTAGHPAPLLADGESFQPLPLEPQLVLGVDKATVYASETFQLPAQASLLLYTDGVVECLGRNGNRFGDDGLHRTLYGRYANAQAILDRVVAAVDEFRGEVELADDLTLVAVQLQATSATVESVAAGV